MEVSEIKSQIKHYEELISNSTQKIQQYTKLIDQLDTVYNHVHTMLYNHQNSYDAYNANLTKISQICNVSLAQKYYDGMHAMVNSKKFYQLGYDLEEDCKKIKDKQLEYDKKIVSCKNNITTYNKKLDFYYNELQQAR